LTGSYHKHNAHNAVTQAADHMLKRSQMALQPTYVHRVEMILTER
jgi:hypothetical protein